MASSLLVLIAEPDRSGAGDDERLMPKAWPVLRTPGDDPQHAVGLAGRGPR